MIDLRHDRDVDVDALVRLRARCQFAGKPADFVAAQLAGSRWLAHARDGDRLVGFARAISDGVSSAYVSSVMVDPDYRRRGIGRALLARLMDGRDDIKFVLHARHDARAFYAAIGFCAAADILIRDRLTGALNPG
jgi:ribosomal protein S18 acetylase RimI-like enzyme